jgi:hypothetical protein
MLQDDKKQSLCLASVAPAMQVKDEHLGEGGSVTAQAPQDVVKPEHR